MFNAAEARAKRPRLNRAQQRVARTQDILEAAWAVYLESGYEGATLEAVAARAGISRMPVYTLFGDKQNLYFELSNMFLDRLVAVTVTPLRSGMPLRRALAQLAKLITSASKADDGPDPASLFDVVRVIALSRPDIAARQRQGAQRIVDAFADAIRKAPLDKGDRLRAPAETVACLIIAQINGLSSVEHQLGRHFLRAADLAALFHAAAFKESA